MTIGACANLYLKLAKNMKERASLQTFSRKWEQSLRVPSSEISYIYHIRWTHSTIDVNELAGHDVTQSMLFVLPSRKGIHLVLFHTIARFRATEKAFLETEYKASVDYFIAHLDRYEKEYKQGLEEEGYYGRFFSVVQSSGSGKTRMIHEVIPSLQCVRISNPLIFSKGWQAWGCHRFISQHRTSWTQCLHVPSGRRGGEAAFDAYGRFQIPPTQSRNTFERDVRKQKILFYIRRSLRSYTSCHGWEAKTGVAGTWRWHASGPLQSMVQHLWNKRSQSQRATRKDTWWTCKGDWISCLVYAPSIKLDDDL